MAPPTEVFPASALPVKVNNLPSGKVRKPHERVDLDECKLLELVQYECELDGDRKDPNTVVKCWPIVRLFRR